VIFCSLSFICPSQVGDSGPPNFSMGVSGPPYCKCNGHEKDGGDRIYGLPDFSAQVYGDQWVEKDGKDSKDHRCPFLLPPVS